MEHTGALLAALRDTLNLTGIGALITGVFLITRGRSDQKVLLKQLQQKTLADDRDDDREDANSLSKRAAEAAVILDTAAKSAAASAEFWKSQCNAAQDELNYRNIKLTEYGTYAAEMLALMAVPGAVQCLRDHRDKQAANSPS